MPSRKRQLTVLVDGEKYYSAQKAQEELGMTYSALRNQVIAGNITSKVPMGKRQAYYRARDVERLATEMKLLMGSRFVTGKFRPMTTDDLLECTKISDMIFGGHIDIDRQKLYAVESGDEVIGYALILVRDPEKMKRVLQELEELTLDIGD